MTRLLPRRALWAWLAPILLACLPGTATATATEDADPLAAVDAAIAAAQAAGSGGARSGGDLDAVLGEARSLRDRAQTLAAQRADLVEQGARAARDLPRLQAELKRDADRAFQVWRDRVGAGGALSGLESLLASENDALTRARERAQRAETAAATLDGGFADAERYAQLKLREDDLSRSGGGATGAQDEALRLARDARQRAELAAVRAEIALLEESRRSADARTALAQAELELARADAALSERKIDWLGARIAAASDSELRALGEQIAVQLAESGDSDPELRRAAESNAALAAELDASSKTLARQRSELQALVQERDRVSAALTNTDARLALASSNELVGRLLLAERRRLGKPARLQARLDDIRSELAEVRLRLIDLPALSVAVLSATLDANPAPAPRDPRQVARISESRSAVLEKLTDRLQRLQDTLEQSDIALRGQLQDVTRLADLLDRELLWIPSHAGVGRPWLGRLPDAIRDFVDPTRWRQAFTLLGGRLLDKPWPALLGTLLALLLFAARSRIRARLADAAPPLRRVREDRYRRSTLALGWTVLLASPWSVLVATLGGQWANAGEPGKFSNSLGLVLIQVAGSLFLLEFLHALTLERGLAHAHFRWTRPRRDAIRRALPLAWTLLLPLQFVAGLEMLRGVEPGVDVIARLALFAWLLCTALLAAWLLAPGALWTPRGRSEPFRLRQALRLVLPVATLALALLLATGYVYSAAVLMGALWRTLWTVVAIAVVHGMLARWFLLGERRLAYERQFAQRESERQDTRGAAGDELPEATLEIVSLESVNAQTSRLLRATTLVLWVAGLLLVWSDLVPALARLDDIGLWNTHDVDAEGQSVLVVVSLRAFLLGLATLALTWIAARNLPGLLEIGLLSRISLDAPSRYAIASVSRYLIVTVGAIVGLGLLGLRWSQLQWMAAALSVGLGFGLQEIFGNFVSGLILLFERPFRVGDVITIGEFSGTVTRIRTRATTLVDFDNKEVVIPNKTFITERLINWTLSDTRTRVVIRVGAAYGSDIDLVHRLLQQAAREQPAVLDDPEPSSFLVGFGASSLDFELRVHVGAIAERMPVTNDLHTRIARLFESHGLEIAFPQLDLHVRDLPATLRPSPG